MGVFEDIAAALDVAVLEQIRPGVFRASPKRPAWLRLDQEEFDLADRPRSFAGSSN